MSPRALKSRTIGTRVHRACQRDAHMATWFEAGTRGQPSRRGAETRKDAAARRALFKLCFFVLLFLARLVRVSFLGK